MTESKTNCSLLIPQIPDELGDVNKQKKKNRITAERNWIFW